MKETFYFIYYTLIMPIRLLIFIVKKNKISNHLEFSRLMKRKLKRDFNFLSFLNFWSLNSTLTWPTPRHLLLPLCRIPEGFHSASSRYYWKLRCCWSRSPLSRISRRSSENVNNNLDVNKQARCADTCAMKQTRQSKP